MADGQKNSTPDETPTNGLRLRDLEAHAFRTSRALAKHSEQLAIRQQQCTVSGNTDFPRNAIDMPKDSTIEQRLGTIERVLFALARTLDVDPEPTD